MPKAKKETPKIKKEKKVAKVEKKSSLKYFFAVGRRKRSVARVKLYQKKGQTLVNGKPAGEYFSGQVAKEKILEPSRLTETTDKYYAVVKVVGGGKFSQMEAFIHGLARALNEADREKYRPALKKAGLLTRDPREKERRKFGLAHKARARKQSPKR